MKIDLGFGVKIERKENDYCKIFNLKSNNEDVMNLGVKLK